MVAINPSIIMQEGEMTTAAAAGGPLPPSLLPSCTTATSSTSSSSASSLLLSSSSSISRENMKRNQEILECQSHLQGVKSRLTTLQQERKHLMALQQVRLSPQAAWSNLTHAQRHDKEFVLAALATPLPEAMGLPHALQWETLSNILRKCKVNSTHNQQNQQQHINNNTNNSSNNTNNNNNSNNHHNTYPWLFLDRDVVLARIARCDFLEHWRDDPFLLTPSLASDVQVMSALIQKDLSALCSMASPKLQTCFELWNVVLQQLQQQQQQLQLQPSLTFKQQALLQASQQVPFPLHASSEALSIQQQFGAGEPSSSHHKPTKRNAHSTATTTSGLQCLNFFAPEFFSNPITVLQLVQATAHWIPEEADADNDDESHDGGEYHNDDDDDDDNGYYHAIHSHIPTDTTIKTTATTTRKKKKNNKKSNLKTISSSASSVLSYLSPELRQDKSFMLQVLHILTHHTTIVADTATTTHPQRPYPTFLKWCSSTLRNDANFVMKVIRAAGGFNLKYASYGLRKDYNICHAAIRSCPWAICFCYLPKVKSAPPPPPPTTAAVSVVDTKEKRNKKKKKTSRKPSPREYLHPYNYHQHLPNALIQQQCIDNATFWQDQVFSRIIQQSPTLGDINGSKQNGDLGVVATIIPPRSIRRETATALWQRVPPHLQQDRTILLLALEAGILTWKDIPPRVYQIDAEDDDDDTVDKGAATTQFSTAATTVATKDNNAIGNNINDDETRSRRTISDMTRRSQYQFMYEDNIIDDDDNIDEGYFYFGNENDFAQLLRNHRHHQQGWGIATRLGLGLFDHEDDNVEEKENHEEHGNDVSNDDDDGENVDDASSAGSSSFLPPITATTITTTTIKPNFCHDFLQQALERNPTVYLSWTEEQQADPDLAWTAIRSCCHKIKEQHEQLKQKRQHHEEEVENDATEFSSGTFGNNSSNNGNIPDRARGDEDIESSLFLPPPMSSSSASWFASSSLPTMTDALEDVVAEASVHVPDVVWQDWHILQYLVQSFVGEDLFQWLPLDMRQDKSLMLLACRADGRLLEYCDEALWHDQEIVQAALQQNPLAADYLPEVIQLQHIPAIAQAMASCSEDDLDELAHVLEEEVWMQRDIILAWIRRERSIGDVWDDADILMVTPRMAWTQTDEEMWLAVAEHNTDDFRDLAPHSLRRNVVFMNQCVERNGSVVVHAMVDDLLNHVDTLVTTAFATSIHAIDQFIDPANFEFMVKASRQIRNDLELHQAFVQVLCGIQYPYESDDSGKNSYKKSDNTNNHTSKGNNDDMICYLPLLNRGLETTLMLKMAIAGYAGVPVGTQLRLLRQASANLAAWGF